MRALAALATVVTLAACSGDEPAWLGPGDLGADGAVPTDGFMAYTADVDETWERSPALVAAEFLRLDEQEARETTIASDAGPEGGGPAG